jgi:hypothetical protein
VAVFSFKEKFEEGITVETEVRGFGGGALAPFPPPSFTFLINTCPPITRPLFKALSMSNKFKRRPDSV